MTYPILDVSDWPEEEHEYGTGERAKKWLTEPGTNRIAMVKFPREDRGEHWAEKLCSEFAKVLGYPCAEVELAVHDGKLACLSYFFVKYGCAHYDGLTFFPDEYDSKRNIGYNFQLVENILTQYGLVEEFLYIVVFDALVGEGDRHQNNWGLTRNESSGGGTFSISPLYDNSASLCRDITSEDAKKMIESRNELLLHIHR